MDSSRTTRRGFIQASAGAVAAGLAWGVDPMEAAAIPQPAAPADGILRLRLQTRDLAAQRRYYVETLQLPILDQTDDSITIGAGRTRLTFSAVAEGRPYYHFAFNIPENKLAAAKEWLRPPGCPLRKRPDGSDEYHFQSWNAHSIYFLDPAGNILEFIARHNLKNASRGAFTQADILYASEIAVVVDDVRATADAVMQQLALPPFVANPSDQFSALGDDHRLLIVVKRGRAWNAGQGRTAEVYPINAVLNGKREGRLASDLLSYEIVQAKR